METFWWFVTDFGDAAVTLPLAVCVALWLSIVPWPRAVVAWLATVGGCGATMALLKLLFRSCGAAIGDASIVSPSGHTAMGAAVYGSLAILATTQMTAGPRRVAVAIGMALAGTIGVSRVALLAHSPAEVAAGLAVGAASVGAFWCGVRSRPVVNLRMRWLAITTVVMIAFMHGTHWPVEEVLRTIAVTLRGAVPACG